MSKMDRILYLEEVVETCRKQKLSPTVDHLNEAIQISKELCETIYQCALEELIRDDAISKKLQEKVSWLLTESRKGEIDEQ